MRAVNLIPTDQRRGGGGVYGRSDGAAYVLVGLLAGVVLLTAGYLLAKRDIADQRAQAATITARVQVATNQAAALAPYTSFIALRNQRLAAVQQLAASRFDWAHAIHELGRVLPYDVSLTSVTGTITNGPAGPTTPAPGGSPAAPGTSGAPAAPGASGAPAAPGTSGSPAPVGTAAAGVSLVQSATPAGSVPSLAISGCTMNQSEVAVTLQRLALVDGVTGVSLDSSTKGTSSGGPPPSGGGGTCPYDSFNVKVSFAPLAAASAADVTAVPAATVAGASPATAPGVTAATTPPTAAPGATAVSPGVTPTTSPAAATGAR